MYTFEIGECGHEPHLSDTLFDVTPRFSDSEEYFLRRAGKLRGQTPQEPEPSFGEIVHLARRAIAEARNS